MNWWTPLLFEAHQVVLSLIAFAAGLVAKTLLDFNIAPFFVKWLWWVPVRNIFRERPVALAGRWEQTWEAGASKNFLDPKDRHAHPILRQFGSYCYAQFFSKGVEYCLFGRLNGSYLVGQWYAKKDPLGYFGAFQLRVVDSTTMEGKWIGHSKESTQIRGDTWTWKKLPT